MRRYRVRVLDSNGAAKVVLRRRGAGTFNHITVAFIDLKAENAEERLADARARATTLAHQVNGLERDRL